jgi:hypothetical protein
MKKPKVIRREIRRIRWLGDDSNVFLGEQQQAKCGSVPYHDAETTVRVTCCAASSELHRATSIKLEPINGPVTLYPGDINSWCTKPPMSKISGNFLTALRYRDDLLSRYLEFDFRQGQELFLYPTASRLALGPLLLSWRG